MKRLDDGKVSFVEFLRSIKFARQEGNSIHREHCPPQFAHFSQRVHSHCIISAEDANLIRSAN